MEQEDFGEEEAKKPKERIFTARVHRCEKCLTCKKYNEKSEKCNPIFPEPGALIRPEKMPCENALEPILFLFTTFRDMTEEEYFGRFPKEKEKKNGRKH